MMKRATTIIILLVGVCINSRAQLRLPTFDIELKGQQNLLPGSGGSGNFDVFESTNWHGGAHIQIGQHFAVGAFYSRSFRGSDHYRDDNNSTSATKDGLLLLKGIDIRVSTSRAKNWRKYMAINYSKLEVVEDNVDYRLAAKSNAIGASVGIMRKLSNKLYLTVIELGVKKLSTEIFWVGSNSQVIVDAKMGLLYNIGKRK